MYLFVFRVCKISRAVLYAADNEAQEDWHDMWAYHICHHEEWDDSDSSSECSNKIGLLERWEQVFSKF
jgi:hypothetical protein